MHQLMYHPWFLRLPALALTAGLLLWSDRVNAQAGETQLTPSVETFVELNVVEQQIKLELNRPGEPCETDFTFELVSTLPSVSVFASAGSLTAKSVGWKSREQRLEPAAFEISNDHLGEFVSLDEIVNLTGPLPSGAFRIQNRIRIRVNRDCPAGEYEGTLHLICGKPLN